MSIETFERSERDQLDRFDLRASRAGRAASRAADVYALERASESVQRDESARRAHELATIGE